MTDKFGARSRTRTGTVFPPRDFKSLASTNFAIRAWISIFTTPLRPTITEALRASVYHNAIRAGMNFSKNIPPTITAEALRASVPGVRQEWTGIDASTALEFVRY